MKRIILCIILFIALIALTAGSYLYIVGTTTRLLNKVEFVSYSYSRGEYEAAFTTAEQAEELWRQFRRRRYLIVDRESVTEISEGLARIKQLTAERQTGLTDEIAVVTSLLRQYHENQKINLYNIL